MLKLQWKKITSITLIVAMVFANNGFFVLAKSVEETIASAEEVKEKNYYETTEEYERIYEEQTIVEEYETYLEEANPELFDSEYPTEDEEIVYEEEEEEESEESKEESLKKMSEETLEKDSKETLDETFDETKEETKEESKENLDETMESTEKRNEEETTASVSDIDFSEETEKVEQEDVEASISETAKEEKENEKEKTIASNSDIDIEKDKVATESEVVEDINVASESEVKEIIASESEIIASNSEIIASESEIVASVSELKNVLIATVSKVNWKVKKIFIATYSSTYAYATESKAQKLARLATCANVILVNDEGDEKLINIPITWKLDKKYEVNEKISRDKRSKGIDAWRKELKIKDEINKKDIVTATDSFAEFVEEVKKENEEVIEKEIVIVAEEKETKEVVEKKEEAKEKVIDEKIKINDITIDTKQDETFDEYVDETAGETLAIIESVKETDDIINIIATEEVKESEEETIFEPTVADFSSSDVATDSDVVEEVKEESKKENIEEVKKETKEDEIKNETEETEVEKASESEVVEEVVDEATRPQIKVDETGINVESGITEKTEFSQYKLNIMEVESIDLYKVDTDKLGEAIIEAIKNENKVDDIVENKEEVKEEKEEKKEKSNSLFGALMNFFGFNNDDAEKEDVEKEDVDKETKENATDNNVADKELTAEEKLIEQLKNAQVEVVDESEVSSMYSEQDNMRFGSDLHPGGNHDIESFIKSGSVFATQKIRLNESDENHNFNEDAWAADVSKVGVEVPVFGMFWLSGDLMVNSIITVPVGGNLMICTNGYNMTFATQSYIKAGENARVTICNCGADASKVSHITTTGPTYNVPDRFKATISDTYTMFHNNPIVEAPFINVIGRKIENGSNIVFDNCQIKNDYVGYNARGKMDDAHNTLDAPENSGGGSILHASKRMKVYAADFKANIATRTNGVAINTQMGELLLEGSNFVDNVNKTNVGGAIAFNPKATYIYDCVFDNNVANTSGGAIYGRIFKDSENGNVVSGTMIEKTKFINNKALIEGGAAYLDYVANIKFGSNLSDNKVVFENNIAGEHGGALAVNHTQMLINTGGGSSYSGYEEFPTNAGSLTFENVDFTTNITKKLQMNSKGEVSETTDKCENAGGAIFINNSYTTKFGGTEYKDKRIINTLNIKKSSFNGNIAEGEEIEIKKHNGTDFYGDALAKYYNNNSGGAIYVKKINQVNIEDVNFNANKSMTGAAICAYGSTLDIASGSFINGGEYNPTYTDEDLMEKIVTPGGGAIYLMDGAKAKLYDKVVVKNNRNAFYLDGGEIDLGESVVEDNKGEYLIGYSNYTIHPSSKIKNNETDLITPYTNRILFSGVDIHKHMYYGAGKDYNPGTINVTYGKGAASTVTEYRAKKSNTYVSFEGSNSINNNRWFIKQNSGLTTRSETTEYCDIKVVSSVSNLKIDLSNSTMRKPEKAKGKIGLYYYLSNPDGLDDTIVFDKWTTAECRVFREGGIWTNYFEVDQSKQYSEPTTDLRLEGWKFYRRDNTIRLSPNIFTVKFDSYIEGVEEIEEQFYNYKRNNQLISIATPTEIIEGAINIPGKTFIGVLGRDQAPGVRASGSYVLWNFDTSRFVAVEQEDDEDAEVMILLYADDEIKVKACGCSNGVPCNHDDPSIQHDATRGTGVSNTDGSKEKNYIMVATVAQMAFRYNDKKTQYVLNKDLTITTKQAKEYLTGDMVLNLNGKKLTYITEDKNDGFIFGGENPDYQYGKENGKEPGTIFIAGKATDSETTPKGKIVIEGKHNGAFVDSYGRNVFISDVDFEGINDEGITDSKAIISNSSTSVASKVYLENCSFNDITLKNGLISSASQIVLKKVTTTTTKKVKITEKPVITLGSVGVANASNVRVIDSNLEGIEAKTFVGITKKSKGAEIRISSSSFVKNIWEENFINASKTVFGDDTKLVFDGKNLIKENEFKKDYLITNDNVPLVFEGSRSETIFDGNKISADNTETNTAILKIASRAEINGTLKMINNSGAKYTVYQGERKTVSLGDGDVIVNGNTTDRNWYIVNSPASIDNAMFEIKSGAKFRASESKIMISLEDNTGIASGQKIMDDWRYDYLYSINSPENVFDRDAWYDSQSDPINKAYTYKQGSPDLSHTEIRFGTNYITGAYKLYKYVANSDERALSDASADPNNNEYLEMDVYRNSIQRIAKGIKTQIDNPRVNDNNNIVWEGMRYKNADNTWNLASESRLPMPLENYKMKEDRDFEISGYVIRQNTNVPHKHGNLELWVEARNEGLLQATSSYAFLHNDMTISREMLYDLEGDFVLCLNGHTLTIDKDMEWLKTNRNLKISICNCKSNGSVKMNKELTKDLITVDNGQFELSKVKIENFTGGADGGVKGRFAKVNTGAKANITDLTLNNITTNYTGVTTEKAFIEISEGVIATYSNLTFTNNRMKSSSAVVGSRSYIMSMKANASDKDYNFGGLKLSGNEVDSGRGSIVAISGYRNVILDGITVENNKTILGTPLDLIGNGTGVCSISNATFDGNMMRYAADLDAEEHKNSVNLGIKGFTTFAMQDSTIKNAGNDFINTNAKQSYLALYLDNVKSDIKNVTFENINNNTANMRTSAIGINGGKDVTFDNCSFRNNTFNIANAGALVDEQKFIDVDAGFTGKLTFKNGTSFDNVAATSIVSAKGGEIILDGLTMNGSKVYNAAFDIKDDGVTHASLVASGSIIKDTTGTTIKANNYVKLFETEISTTNPALAGDKYAVDFVHADDELTVGGKVVIKGYKKNVHVLSGTKVKIDPTAMYNQIKDASEIYLSPDIETVNYDFFDNWSSDYIEKFNYHNFDTTNPRWYYFPENVFKPDTYLDAAWHVYSSGGATSSPIITNDNAILTLGKTGYAILDYKDVEVEGRGHIAYQYIKATTTETRLDVIHVNYLSTSSQVWMAYLDKTNPLIATPWKVNRLYSVSNLAAGETYEVLLTKKHIHKECGPDLSVACYDHIDGETHTTEYDFREVKETEDFKDNDDLGNPAQYFGLTEDVTITQDVIDHLNTIPANPITGDNSILICLHGHTLTIDEGASFGDVTAFNKKLIFVNCEEEGVIKASNSVLTKSFVNTNNALKFYNVKFETFTTEAPVVKVADGKEIFFENTTFKDITLGSGVTLDAGIVKLSAGATYIDNLVLDHNIATNSSLIKISNDNLAEDKVRTFTITNNTYKDKLVNVDGGTNKVKNITINDNTIVGTESVADGPYGALYLDNGASFTVTEDFVIKGNDASVNEHAKGGAVAINNGTLKLEKLATFENNKAGLGGAVYVKTGNFEAATTSTFKGNEAKIGAALYIDGNPSTLLNIKDLVFDDNKSTENGVLAWGGGKLDLNGHEVTIKNHKKAGGKSIIYNFGTNDGFDADNLIIKDNATNAPCILLTGIAVASNIKNIDARSMNNSFASMIDIENASAAVNITDCEFKNDYYTDATIKLKDSATNVNIEDVTITNNSTTHGGLSLDNTQAKVTDPIFIADNLGGKDVYTSGPNGYVVMQNQLASPSKLGFSAYDDGAKVFEAWDSTHIENYDVPDESADGARKYAHTPETSEIIYRSTDAASNGYDLYKDGTDLYIGSDRNYVTVWFKSNPEDDGEPETTYLVQHIASNSATKLDKVNMWEGIPLNKQRWEAKYEDGTDINTWNFGAGAVNVNLASPVIARYMKPHIHAECGLDNCATHEVTPFGTHAADVEYAKVKTLDDIMNLTTEEYFSLQKDIVLDSTLDLSTSGFKGICLNGHKFIASGSITNLINAPSSKFIICDCKHTGGFTDNGLATVSNAIINSTNQIEIYGINVDKMNMADAVFVKASAGLRVEGATLSNITKTNNLTGLLNNNPTADKNEYANISLVNNSLLSAPAGTNLVSFRQSNKDNLKGYLRLKGNNNNSENIVYMDQVPANLKSLQVEENSSGYSIISMSNGTTINISEDVEIKENTTKHGSVWLRDNSSFKVNDTAKKVDFINNYNEGEVTYSSISTGQGGVFNLQDNNVKLEIATASLFKGNKAKDGAAIYASKLDGVNSYVKLKDATFDSNNAAGFGVINVSGILELKDIIFKNQSNTSPELIYMTDKNSQGYERASDNELHLENATFLNNTTGKSAISIKNATKSYIKNIIKENMTGNTFKNFLYVDKGDIAIENVTIDTNPMTEAAIKLDDAKVAIAGQVVVKGNGASKNVVLSGNSVLKGYEDEAGNKHKLSSNSEIYVIPNVDKKIYEGWNEDFIESFAKPSYDATATTQKNIYLPENSGLFISETAGTLYKSGTRSDIYVDTGATEFVKVRFIKDYDPDDDDESEGPFPREFGYQNIAKGVETSLDVVDIFDYEIKNQKWEIPTGSTIEEKSFADASGNYTPINVKYDTDQVVKLVSMHIHKVCGDRLYVDCVHPDYTGAAHTGTVLYKKVNNVTDLDWVTGDPDYLTLTADLVLNDTNFNKLSSYKGLCLNGHKITYVVENANWGSIPSTDIADPVNWPAPSSNGLSISGTFDICDCKAKKGKPGYLTARNEFDYTATGVAGAETTAGWEAGAYRTDAKVGSYIDVSGSGKLSLYNVHVATMCFATFGTKKGCFIKNSGGTVYMDSPVFTGITGTGADGIISGSGNVILTSPELTKSNLSPANPLLVINPNITISSLSVIDNQRGNGTLVKTSGDVEIGEVVVRDNKSYGSVIEVPNGSTLTIKARNEFLNNSRSVYGVFNVGGVLNIEKELVFDSNNCGALYITSTGKVNATATVSFINNRDTDRSAIYVDGANNDSLSFTKAIFINNKVTAPDSAIVAWNGDLKLENVEFKNHETYVYTAMTATTIPNTLLKNDNPGTDTLILNNVSFVNNKIDGSAIILNRLASPSKITNILSDESVVKEKTTKTLIEVKNNSEITFEDLDIHGFECKDSIIKVVDSPKTVFNNVKFENNTTETGGTVVVSGAPVGIKGKITIKDNTGHDIYLVDSTAYLKGVGDATGNAYIDPESDISIDIPDTENNMKVFEGWNRYNFERYDNADKTRTPIEYMYTPEGSDNQHGVFYLNDKEKAKNYKYYKSGTTGDVKLGDNFAVLTFKNDYENHSDVLDEPITYGTQNIEKGVETKLDKVDTYDYELKKQDWDVFEVTGGPRVEGWIRPFTDAAGSTILAKNVTFNSDKNVVNVYKHIHKVCGLTLIKDCDHLDGDNTHSCPADDMTKEYKNISLASQLESTTEEYVGLTADITVSGTLNLSSSIKGICLNGHKITCVGGDVEFLNITSGTLDICNCRKKGEITATDTFRTNMIVNNGAKLNIRKATFSGIALTGGAVINRQSGNVFLEDVTFTNMQSVGSTGVLSGIAESASEKYTLSNLNFVKNNNSSVNPLVTLKEGMKISTVSFIDNEFSGSGSAFKANGTLELDSLIVKNNKTEGNGIINIPNGTTLKLNNGITLENNKAKNGGSVYIDNGGKLIASNKTVFKNNEAIEKGGAIYIKQGGKAEFADDVTFEGNKAVNGSSIYAERLTTGDLSFASGKAITFTKENASDKGIIAWGGDLVLASVSFVDNASGCGEMLSNIHTDGTDTLDISDSIFENNTSVKGAIALDHVGASKIFDTKINNNTFTNAGLYLVNDSAVTIKNIEMDHNAAVTYGAIYIGNTNNVKTMEDVVLTCNATTGSYGAAITLDNVDTFDNFGTPTGDARFEITGSISASGGAVYLNGKMGISGKVNITGNLLTNNAARNVFIASDNGYLVATDKIKADSTIGITTYAKNAKVYERWEYPIIEKVDHPDSTAHSYTPENSGLFIADAGAGAGEFYKSGVGSTESIKLGDNFAKLTFKTADGLNTYSVQNIEKNVDTRLDKVMINQSNYSGEKWIAPKPDDPTSDYIWMFASGDIVANYTANQDIIKQFMYTLRYTAGSHASDATGHISDVQVPYGQTISIQSNPYTAPSATFLRWRLKVPINGIPTEFEPGDTVKNLCVTENGIAELQAAWEGEFYVRFYPNGEKVGLSIPYDASFDRIGHNGESVYVGATYPQEISGFKYDGYTIAPNGGASYGIGSSVSGNNNEIKLYCNWYKPETPYKPSHRGGGGGGGSAHGSALSANGMWINGVWVPFEIDPLHPVIPILDRFVVDDYGNIKSPKGDIVGNIWLGDRVNDDGTFTDVNGNTHLLDGSVRDINGITYNVDGSLSLPDGKTYYLDGSIRDVDGNIYHKDGSITYANGIIKDAFGLIHGLDGSLMTEAGIIYYQDGSVVFPDGTKILPDGTILKVGALPGGANKKTDGTWEYDPVTSGWKFFTVDATGNKSYYKDEWVFTNDKNGNSQWYAINAYGNMVTGWVKVNGDFYYMSPEANTRGELVKGKITIAGKTYELDPTTGKLLGNQTPVNFDVLGAENHKSGVDGDWVIDPNTGKKKFIVKKKRVDGQVASETPAKGWYMVDGLYYNFNNDGEPNIGLIISDGKYYYMEPDGHMLEGGSRTVNGVTYEFDKATGACRSSYV